jgi:hypothetical protein
MLHESRELMTDDLKLYSEGLITALKQDKLVEAREYVANLRPLLDDISKYLDSNIQYEQAPSAVKSDDAFNNARTEADRAD